MTVQQMLDQSPEGTIMSGFSDSFDLSLLAEMREKGVPIVAGGEMTLPDVDTFQPDKTDSFEQVTAYLIGLGRR